MERLILWHRALPGTPLDGAERHALMEAIEAAGGRVLGCLGSSVAGSFRPDDLPDAVDLALSLVGAAEDDEEAPAVGLGLALGEVTTAGDGAVEHALGPRPLGECIDRAELLANRARAYEVVLDTEARQRAARHYLFGRSVGTGSAAARGHAVDREHPRRAEARRALTELSQTPGAEPIREALAPWLSTEAPRGRLLVARGPDGAGLLPVLREHVDRMDPAWVLELRGTAGGLACLGSLRDAVGRARVREDARDTEADPRRALAGRLLSTSTRAEAITAWRELLRASAPLGGGLVLLRLGEPVDVSSVELVGAGLEDPSAHRVVADLPLDEPVPLALTEHAEATEVTLPPLRTRDARRVAGEVLGLDPGTDLARRVAVLGGDTPLGVSEAARTLVASGDLIGERGDWHWRVAPRGGVCAIPTEALLDERVEALGPDARRALDLLAAAPPGTPEAALVEAWRADGLDEDRLDGALAELRAEGLTDAEPSLDDAPVDFEHRLTRTLRNHLLLGLPSARIAELRGMLSSAATPDADAFDRARRGYLLAEGGRSDDAATELLAAAHAAHRAGWSRAAVRLAANAVQTAPTGSTRQAALSITRAPGVAVPDGGDTAPDGLSRPTPAELEEAEGEPTARAIRALVEGDFETVDRFIDLAVAEGHDLAATDRLRAMSRLLRRDVGAAQRLLERAVERGGDDPRQRARAALATAWLRLHDGHPHDAVRACLDALARSRERADARGEAAALRTLATCYHALGRDAQAARIAGAAR